MEVILIQDLANLGFKNDIVKVRDGYGRNYLLPQKIAIIANESNKKQLAENLKQQAHKAAKILADAQALEAKLAETVIEVKVKANEDGKIFGTVTTQNISLIGSAMVITFLSIRISCALRASEMFWVVTVPKILPSSFAFTLTSITVSASLASRA